ncbi:hypothetical protein BGX34_004139, partial [Mortierella sp. NVP85]
MLQFIVGVAPSKPKWNLSLERLHKPEAWNFTVIYTEESTDKQLQPMVFGSVISSPRASLSLQQALELANIYLENARKTQDPKLALVLCHDTEVSLSHVKKVAKHVEDNTMREGIASAYIGLGELLHEQGLQDEAQAFYKKSEKWG